MATTPSGSGARKWILVVDDNSRLRNLWIEVLERAGYAAVGSEDGLSAGELIRDLFPDLILLDLRMPRASGWDFLENVRANPKWHTIPVVLVSAHLDEGPDLAADCGLNIVGRMAKPVAVADLLAKVQELIGPAPPRPA
ncbi:MAG TPA: response regulator [Methylomirabilota bacterium]|nr:response regulator [Methylomirabilota bacterium]